MMRRMAAVGAIATAWTLTTAHPALAHDCGSLSDCYRQVENALWVFAMLAAMLALLLLLGGGGGGLVLAGGGAVGLGAAEVAAITKVLVGAGATAAGAATIMQMASRKSGKERASDIPSWAKGMRPRPGETPVQAAHRVLRDRYGHDQFPRGPGSEFNKIKKFFERLLRS